MNQSLVDVGIDYQVTDSWNNGFIGEIDLTNEGDRIKDWTVTFETEAEIEKYWNAELVSKSGNRYTFKAASWNDDLKTGETTTLGFKGKGDKSLIPSNYSFDSEPFFTSTGTVDSPASAATPASTVDSSENADVEIDYEVTESWNGGFIGNVNFTNEGDRLEDWTISFETKAEIEEYWNAELVSQKGNRYTFNAVSWNDDLGTGESVNLGFKGKGNKSLIPSNYSFNGQTLADPTEQISQPAVASAANTASENPASSPTNSSTTPSQSQPSSNAIVQSFENHSDGTAYVREVQEQDWNVQWSVDSQMSKFAEITTEEAFSGDNSLRITHRPDERSQGSAAWEIPEKDVYYLSYKVKFEEGFDFDGDVHSGGKLPGLASSDGWCSGGQNCNGSNGFTSRYMWDEGGKAKLYLYHMDKPGKWGENLFFKDISGQDVYFEPGTWHELTQRVEINDGNQKNGSIDVWMDGEQVLDIDNLRFVNNGSGIDSLHFSVFHGGSGSDWYPDREVYSYYDDFVISTNPADVGL